MPLFTDASRQFRQMDRFSCGNTGIHRLDARIKIGAFLVYQICVLSWPPQEITGLLPFFLFPVCVIRLAGLPLGYLLKRALWLLPVAVMIGIFNPLVDRTPMGEWFGIPVTQGMISFISIILRCMLTILGAFTLLASTGFAPLCRGLRQLGAPRILITLMAFLYRYAFILVDECQHMLMAFRSRRGGSGPIPLSTWGPWPDSSCCGHSGGRNAFTRPSCAEAGKILNSPVPAASSPDAAQREAFFSAFSSFCSAVSTSPCSRASAPAASSHEPPPCRNH